MLTCSRLPSSLFSVVFLKQYLHLVLFFSQSKLFFNNVYFTFNTYSKPESVANMQNDYVQSVTTGAVESKAKRIFFILYGADQNQTKTSIK